MTSVECKYGPVGWCWLIIEYKCSYGSELHLLKDYGNKFECTKSIHPAGVLPGQFAQISQQGALPSQSAHFSYQGVLQSQSTQISHQGALQGQSA